MSGLSPPIIKEARLRGRLHSRAQGYYGDGVGVGWGDEPQRGRSLAVRPWGSDFIFLSFSFSFVKRRQNNNYFLDGV